MLPTKQKSDFQSKETVICDYCAKIISDKNVYYCKNTGEILHIDCLYKWARAQVRKCTLENLFEY